MCILSLVLLILDVVSLERLQNFVFIKYFVWEKNALHTLKPNQIFKKHKVVIQKMQQTFHKQKIALYIYILLYIYIYLYPYISIYLYISIYIYIYIYIYITIYMYIYLESKLYIWNRHKILYCRLEPFYFMTS